MTGGARTGWRRDMRIALLPLVAWVGFACALNATVWWLNG